MSKHPADAECRRLAKRRYGVVHRDEAIERGMTRRMIQRRLSALEWTIVFPETYALFPADPLRQRSMAACLWAGEGSVVTGPTAAALFGVDCPSNGQIHLVTARRLRASGVTVHRVGALKRRDLTRIGPIPVAHPIRTLIDLATCLDPADLETALDSAWRMGLISIDGAIRRVRELGTQGRKGLRVLERILAERLPTEAAPESGLETRFMQRLKDNGLPAPLRQVEVAGFRLDFLWPERGVAVETDGWAFHASRSSFENDRKKQNALAALGITLLRITTSGLDRDPRLSDLRRALRWRGLDEQLPLG